MHPCLHQTAFPRTLCLALALVAAACGSPPPTATAKAAGASDTPATTPTPMPMDFYSLATKRLDGTPANLGDFRGKVTLVVNVASACGYTPQYAGLQKLHTEWQGRGFAVLGFPSNDFGEQEPGTADQIREFCSTKYGVTFPMFAKVATKTGPGQSNVYSLLGQATGKLPNWNFCKYLVGADGKVLGFYPSRVAPDSPELRAAIEAALK